MSHLADSLRTKHKFVRASILSHPVVSTWCQINWKAYKTTHERYVKGKLAHLALICVYVCLFCFWSTSTENHAAHVGVLSVLWVVLLAASALYAVWEVDKHNTLGSTLYFYHAETYVNLLSLILPAIFGFPLGYLAQGYMATQRGILVFAPAVASVSFLTVCGGRPPGKAVMMFIRMLDQVF
jgi:hypothetical protein